MISIVGVLAVAAAPRFLSVSDLAASRAHRQAIADLRHARQLASASGCPVQVDFDAAGYRLTHRSGCRSGPFDRDIVDPVSNRAPFDVRLDAGVTITSDVDPLVFDSIGRATTVAGATTNARLEVAGRAIEAVGETGLVRAP